MSSKRGGRRFGAHTLRLTKLFPVTYSVLTFQKKILTRHTHTSTRSSGGLEMNLSESSGFGKKSNTVFTRHTHTCRTHTPSSSLNYPKHQHPKRTTRKSRKRGNRATRLGTAQRTDSRVKSSRGRVRRVVSMGAGVSGPIPYVSPSCF